MAAAGNRLLPVRRDGAPFDIARGTADPLLRTIAEVLLKIAMQPKAASE